jgi:hypothetical protein
VCGGSEVRVHVHVLLIVYEKEEEEEGGDIDAYERGRIRLSEQMGADA